MQATLKVSQRTLQHRRSMRRTIKTCPCLFWMLRRLRRSRVVFRNRLLIVAQHVHPKSLARMQMCVRPRPMIHTNQHQHRIQRNRRKSIRRHPMDFAILVHRNHRHSRREASHRSTEIAATQAHAQPHRSRPLEFVHSKVPMAQDFPASAIIFACTIVNDILRSIRIQRTSK